MLTFPCDLFSKNVSIMLHMLCAPHIWYNNAIYRCWWDLHGVVSSSAQDTNPMQAIAVSKSLPVWKEAACLFFFSSNPVFFKLRTLKTHQCPSRSSDSSVSCVWSSCSTAPRESVTCCGPSSSLSRSLFSHLLSSFLYSFLLTVLVFCLQALPHVALLIVMLFFIYAVIGMQVLPVPVWMNE